MAIDGLSKFSATYIADAERDAACGRDLQSSQDPVTVPARARIQGPLGRLSAIGSSRAPGNPRFVTVNGDVKSVGLRCGRGTISGKLVESSASLFDAAASGLSLTCSRLSATPVAQEAAGAASGVLWAVGAGINQVANRPHSYGRSGVNLLGATAGILSTAGSFISGNTGTGVAYSSAASWAANGAATIARALQTGNNTASCVLHVASGTANIAAAALAAVAAKATSENDETTAAKFGTASSVLWGAGALAALGAAATASRATPGNADEMNPHPQTDDSPAS